MEKNQYQDILRRAFLISWKNKFLWFFGFLVLLGSVFPSTDINNQNITKQFELEPTIKSFMEQHVAIFLTLLAFLVLVVILLFILKIIATSALIRSASNIPLYKQLSLIAIFKEAKVDFWKLFVLEFIVSITMGLTIAIVSLPVSYLFFLKAKLFAFLALISAILIIVPLLALAYYLRKYAYFYIVLGKFSVKVSLEMAYNTFIKNLKPSIVMGLISLIFGLSSIIAIPLLVLAALIIIAPLVLIAYLTSAKIALIVIMVLGFVFLFTVLSVFFSWYISFLQTAWLLFFQQISFEKTTEKKVAEKIEAKENIPNPEVA